MADNAQKTPLARSLNAVAQRRALDVMSLQGRVLPASVLVVAGSIVTVKFEINSKFTLSPVTCPIGGIPEYIRCPTQVGDKGVVMPSNTYIGGISGLGGGVADLTVPASLSALIFLPIASTQWSATDDPNAVVIYGPDGVILRNTANTNSVKVGPNGITFTDSNGNIITMNAAGITLTAATVIVTGNLQVDGTMTGKAGSGLSVGLTTHTHPDPQGGNSGPPNQPS